MTEDDLQTLRQRWPSGWHEIGSDGEGAFFDYYAVPYPGDDCDSERLPMLLITLMENGQWELHTPLRWGDDRAPGPMYDTLTEAISAA